MTDKLPDAADMQAIRASHKGRDDAGRLLALCDALAEALTGMYEAAGSVYRHGPPDPPGLLRGNLAEISACRARARALLARLGRTDAEVS